MKIIVTNNKKTKKYFEGKAVIIEADSYMQVFEEGLKIVLRGGRLLHDPSKRHGCYKSLAFTMNNKNISAERDFRMLKKCTDKVASHKKGTYGSKEPIFAGILQNHDLNCIKLIG